MDLLLRDSYADTVVTSPRLDYIWQVGLYDLHGALKVRLATQCVVSKGVCLELE